jgi:hypothetical protein
MLIGNIQLIIASTVAMKLYVLYFHVAIKMQVNLSVAHQRGAGSDRSSTLSRVAPFSGLTSDIRCKPN